MKIAIMQPYLFPYIGYFQLIQAVEKFVIYDNIEYTKKGWINRNRILMNGKDLLFSIPLKKDSDFLDVRERWLADNASEQVKKLKGQLQAAYAKAPQYKSVMPLLDACLDYPDKNLFAYIFHSVKEVCSFLGIQTSFVVSSALPVDHSLKGEDKVIAIAKSLQAQQYINAIGGQALYSRERFAGAGIELKFIQSGAVEYPQAGQPFVPHLSIIDVLMYNSKETISRFLTDYTLI